MPDWPSSYYAKISPEVERNVGVPMGLIRGRIAFSCSPWEAHLGPRREKGPISPEISPEKNGFAPQANFLN